MELTDRQEEMLRCIASHVDQHGTPPTLREIGTAMAIKSTNGVNDHLQSLMRKGAVTRQHMRSRSLRLTDEAEETLGLREPRDELERAAGVALRALENVLERKRFALSHARLAAEVLRRAGVR